MTYPIEHIELRGFLHADGSCMIIKQKRTSHGKYEFINYVPRVNITQREDNLPFLEYVLSQFGGHITENKSARKTHKFKIYQWTVQNLETCEYLSRLMADTDIPYAKRVSAQILNDLCTMKLAHKGRYSKEQIESHDEMYRAIRFANSGKVIK